MDLKIRESPVPLPKQSILLVTVIFAEMLGPQETTTGLEAEADMEDEVSVATCWSYDRGLGTVLQPTPHQYLG